MTYQTSRRYEKLWPSRSIREGQSHPVRSKLLGRPGLSIVRFTAGHKMQTVFGAPGDACVYHSASRLSRSISKIVSIVFPLTESLSEFFVSIPAEMLSERRESLLKRVYFLVKLPPLHLFKGNAFICNRIYLVFFLSLPLEFRDRYIHIFIYIQIHMYTCRIS